MLLAAFSACAPAVNQTAVPFIAPTMLPPTLPADTPTAAPPQPTPLPICSNNLTYISDLTIPDGSIVKPGEVLDKRWRIENSGSCNWDERYRLRLTGGQELGSTADIPLYPARSHSQAVIRMRLSAPTTTGSYRSAWQAFDPDGTAFGDPIFIDILVQ
jgi:hypothetical protein